jgi:hypothetical protein
MPPSKESISTGDTSSVPPAELNIDWESASPSPVGSADKPYGGEYMSREHTLRTVMELVAYGPQG